MAQIERGVSGQAVMAGQIAYVEPNAKLRENAYGGLTDVGIYEQMRLTDPQIEAVLHGIESQICGLDWSIVPADEDTPEEAVDLVASALDDLRGGFRSTLRELLRYLQFGFWLSEIVYRRRPDKRMGWERWASRPPKTIEWWYLGEHDELEGVRQYGWRGTGWETIELRTTGSQAVDLLHLANRGDAGNLTGVSVIRPAYSYWEMKQQRLRTQAINHERFGSGFVDITMPAEAVRNEKEKAIAETVARKWRSHEQAYFAHGPGWALDVKFPTVWPDVVNDLNYLDRQILMVALAQFMALGQGSTGSYALADVQKDPFLQGVQSIVNYVEDVLNGRGWPGTVAPIRKLCELNFGPLKSYPRIDFGSLRASSLTEFVAQIVSLRQAGAIELSSDDRNILRGRLGLGPETEAEPEPIAATPASHTGPEKDAEDETDSGAQPDPAQEELEDAKPATLRDRHVCWDGQGQIVQIDGDGRSVLCWRELMPRERVLCLADARDVLDTSRDGLEAILRPLQVQQAARYEGAVRAVLGLGGDLAQIQRRIEAIPLGFQAEIEEAVRAYLGRTADRFQTIAKRELTRAAQQPRVEAMVGRAVKPTKALAPVEDLGRYVETKAREIARKASAELLDSLRATAVRAATQATSSGQVAEMVAQVPVLRAASTYRRLWATAGTSTMTAARDMVALAWAQEHDEKVRAVTYSAIMDEATCDRCEARDGQEFAYGGDEYWSWLPGNNNCTGGPNCRCIYIYDMEGD